MCFSFFFFDALLGYFILLLFCTIFRKDITYKGIFFLLTFFLLIFSIYLMFNFSAFFIFNITNEFRWDFNSNVWSSLEISLSLKCDVLSYFFVLLVSIIGFGTNLYILNYFKYEANEDIFTILINWFMFSMIILVLADNLFTLFLGWESIGLSSFFLINFWSTRRGTVKSSFKAFFFNKISDLFLFVALVLINITFSVNNLSLLNYKVLYNIINITGDYETAIFCLFFCTMFKSAQLFGHLWLPDSMEAPVPASALIHSATLVSAGIYLLLRFTPLVCLSSLHILAIGLGSITAAYGAIISASQTDMKKLLAYSTISHCGFLFVTVGTQMYTATIIYLFLHGLFKALTFFCAGSFIRVAGSQDTRLMGNLNRILPVDTVFLIVCAFNLGGLPFSVGYLYKSIFIASMLSTNTTLFFFGLCVVGLLSSIIYVYRLVFYSAFDTSKEFFPQIVYHLQQKQINVVKYWSFTSPIQIMAVYSVFLFSLIIYIYFLNYFVNTDLAVENQPLFFSINSSQIWVTSSLYKSFYEFFYSLYTLVFLILFLVVWRVEYTFLYKINAIISIIILNFFLIIYSSLLQLLSIKIWGLWGHILTVYYKFKYYYYYLQFMIMFLVN